MSEEGPTAGRLTVLRGRATPQEIAAVVAAVDAAVEDATADRGRADAVDAAPAWLRAALAEGVGARRSSGSDELPVSRW